MNRKQRNLQYIRAKNNLRRGRVSFYTSEKVSDIIKPDSEYFNNLIKTAETSLLKKYKIKLNTIKLHPAYLIEDDFTKNLVTHSVELKNIF